MTIFTLEKLYQAYLDCRKTKRNTINALKFEWNLERNLFKLQKELIAKKYKPGRSICFVVKEPSPREIFAASFRDRVVHHLLINEVEEIGEKNFIFDTYSCRKNKGTHLAIKRLRKFIRKATNNQKNKAFYLQLDIAGFFMAIDKNILYSLFRELVLKQNKLYQWKKDVLWLAKVIIFHEPTKNYIVKGKSSLFKLIPPRKSLFQSKLNKGLPIGNYSSQFFANLYLNELDQFIKRTLKCRYYVRYVDDFIILGRDKKRLNFFIDSIDKFLQNNLDLKLNSSKTKLQAIDNGIDFLGYFVKPDYVLVRRKVVKRLKQKLYFFDKRGKTEEIEPILATINSYYGHFKHAYSFNLRKDIYDNHLGTLQKIFEPKSNCLSLNIKKRKEENGVKKKLNNKE